MPRNIQLFVTDPQNDFMDIPGAALPVEGASEDMQRLAALITAAGSTFAGITVTLDSHHSVGIERPAMWRKGDGGDVAPFTQITSADVRAGLFAPRQPNSLPRVLTYLDALETGGRYTLMIWPVHCEIGSWGHNVYEPVRRAYNGWEQMSLRPVRTVLKGMNGWTEHYSALQAEVPDPRDPGTQLNRQLIDSLDAADEVVITGEASSHCVRATMEDLADNLASADIEKLVLLSDCMSPVAGFEQQADQFLSDMSARGARVMTSAEWLQGHD